MFASRSIAVHLLRGAVGFGALAAAMLLAASHPVWSLAALPAAFVALRGCPTCWTVGLVQTIAARVRGKGAPACPDGSCAAEPR